MATQTANRTTTARASKSIKTTRVLSSRRVLKPSQTPKKLHPTKLAHRMKDGVLDTHRINVQNRIRSSVTGTRNLDEAVHKVNQWLKELMVEMKWDNRERALNAYRATLHALRDTLPLHEAIHFGAQLPLILKGVYYEAWTPKDTPPYAVKSKEDFHDLVRMKLGTGGSKYGKNVIPNLIFAIFQSLVDRMGEDTMRKVQHLFRSRAQELFPGPTGHESQASSTQDYGFSNSQTKIADA